MIAWNLPRFDLGQVVATPGALAALNSAGQAPTEFLERHVRGDWGEVADDGQEANEQALQNGSRLLSIYPLGTGVKLWIITEACGSNGRRASTCLLLPHEY